MVLNAWSFVEEYEQLSDNQKQAVELPYDQNQLITGVSGSGKTVVVGHRAIRIKENLNVQILVFNKLLHESLQQSLGDKLDETEITTLVTWFKEWFKKEYEQEPPKDDDSVWPNWHKCKEIHSRHRLLHDQLETAGTHFIIDEAQHVPEKLWYFLKLAAGPQAITVLLDENKPAPLDGSESQIIKEKLDITNKNVLEKDFRSSPPIREFVFYCSGKEDHSLLSVQSEETLETKSKPTLSSFPDMASSVKAIKEAEKNALDEIIVVALQTHELIQDYKDLLANEPIRQRAAQVYESDHQNWMGSELSFSEPGIKILTWASLGGLEFETLFIPEIQTSDASEWERENFLDQLYLLASRAKTHLHISYSGSGEPKRIIELLPLELLEDTRATN